MEQGLRETVSVIIPSYRGSRRLLELVEKIVNDDYEHKEVIVIVDDPLPDVVKRLKRYEGKIKLITRNGRHGKLSALIRACSEARGDILLFLDDDVIPNCDGFVRKIVEAMRGYDIGEVRKIITGKSLLARMVYYDYVGFNYGNYLFAKKIGRCVGLNGAAFVITRESLERVGGFKPAIAEDLELGLQSYKVGLRFTYIKDPAVLNDPPSNWREWFRQRVRWSVGAAVWIQRHWRTLLRMVKKNPVLVFLVLLFLLPTLASLASALLIHSALLDKLVWLALLSLSSYHPAFAIATLLLSYRFLYTLFKAWIVSLVSFAVYSVFYFVAARKTDLRFNPLEFAIYFFAYAPLWLTLLLAGFIRVLVFKRKDISSWPVKVSDGR